MYKVIALIPARAGSTRVKGKNVRPLMGHPLLAYSIAAAQQSGVFDRVVVTTDSEEFAEIARHYGADTPFLRPSELAASTSPDIEWIVHAFDNLEESYDAFSIVRPTSPFRTGETIKRAWKQFLDIKNIDSIRAVELCHEHPGKMWILDDAGPEMRPLLDIVDDGVPSYDAQYQALQKVYVQNSSLEIAWTAPVLEHRLRGGRKIAPFLTEEYEGFSIDYEEEWGLAEIIAKNGRGVLPVITQSAFAALN